MKTQNVVKIIQVICVNTQRGKGTPEDPVRRVIEFWAADGSETLLAVDDEQHNERNKIALNDLRFELQTMITKNITEVTRSELEKFLHKIEGLKL